MLLRVVLSLVWIAGRCAALPWQQLVLDQRLSTSTSPFPLDDVFEQKVNWALEHFKTPGLAVAVIRGNDTFLKGYGFSDLETSSPVTEHTHFFAGSTSKAFLAAAVSLLVDDNVNYPQIQWDTTVNSIIPEDFVLSDDWYTAHVTIEDALSHRSGLPRHDMTWMFANTTLKDTIRKLRDVPITEPIRTKYQYCNLMYMSVAHLLETVTGQYLGDFLRERIWEPLNMTDTYLSLEDAQAAGAHISRPYVANRTGGIEDYDYDHWDHARGAGMVLSTASDYAKWIRAMMHRTLPVSTAGHAALTSAHSISLPAAVLPDTAPEMYGLGWSLHVYRTEMLYEHNGAQPGFGTQVMYLPNQDFGLALFSNNMIGGSVTAAMLAYHLIDEFMGIPEEKRFDWVSRGDREIAALTEISPEVIRSLYPSVPDPPLPISLTVSAYEGIYVHPAYPTFNVSTDCPPYTLIPPFTNRSDGEEAPSPASRLCATIVNGILPCGIELKHVSGNFWLLAIDMFGERDVMRAEFKLGPEGNVTEVGIEFEYTMRPKGEKIWFHRG